MASPTSDNKVEDWTADAVDKYDFVRFTVADIHGIARYKLIPRHHVADNLRTGITMSASMSVATCVLLRVNSCRSHSI